MSEQQDFIATELLRELKLENERKSAQLKKLNNILFAVIITAFACLLILVGVFVWYLNQYDFVSEAVSEYSTVQTAEGVYAIIDSAGNVVGHDLTPDQLETVMGELNNGEGLPNDDYP